MANNNRKYARVVTSIPGPQSKKYFDLDQKYISPGIQTIATSSQLTMEKGEGCMMEDVDGNRFIDFFAGVGVASLGYHHPKYTKMMQEQVAKIHVGSFTSKVRAELSQLLAEHSLGDLKRTQYYSAGAEAVEAALRLAKSYTKKNEFIGFWGGFHGKTMGVLGLLSGDFKFSLGPLPAGIYETPYADCRHCPFNASYPGCKFECIDFLKKKIKNETTNNIAAIIVEPIQGTAGNVVPPPEFLKHLREVTKEIGALLICDEMITGFGRTGKMFGTQHFDIVPDIITIGKGFGGGFPMTGLMSRDEIINAKPFANPSGSSSSYGGNPFASAAALATVRTIIEDNLVDNSAKVGAYMLERFEGFKKKFPFVGDVRGKGLMIGLSLVKKDGSKEKLDKQTSNLIFQECLKRGLIIMGYNPEIRINPPLVITKEVAEEGIDIMDEVFTYVADQINI
ncbi:MAG TPA: aspartate aminotransferase family protein [Bacteroidota bacterium]|nr:aspartate aminotransferase family protein [Bacteroidota bacterium]